MSWNFPTPFLYLLIFLYSHTQISPPPVRFNIMHIMHIVYMSWRTSIWSRAQYLRRIGNPSLSYFSDKIILMVQWRGISEFVTDDKWMSPTRPISGPFLFFCYLRWSSFLATRPRTIWQIRWEAEYDVLLIRNCFKRHCPYDAVGERICCFMRLLIADDIAVRIFCLRPPCTFSGRATASCDSYFDTTGMMFASL